MPGYFGYLGPELEEWFAADSAAPQVSIMARRTYETMASLPEEHRDERWEQITQLHVGVLSNPDTRVDWPNARVCHEDLAEEIRRLKAESDVPLRTIGSLSVAQ